MWGMLSYLNVHYALSFFAHAIEMAKSRFNPEQLINVHLYTTQVSVARSMHLQLHSLICALAHAFRLKAFNASTSSV